MLQGVEKLERELDRLRRPRTAMITPVPGGQPVEVGVGEAIDIVYEGEARRVRVMAIMPWGIRAWDEAKSGMRSFRLDKIGQKTPHETDEAAQA